MKEAAALEFFSHSLAFQPDLKLNTPTSTEHEDERPHP